VPKLWTETIEEHRRAVHEAILDTAWTLATERGPLSVTMSQIAEAAGIGRATLYKYFPDVEAILFACHQRHVAEHLSRLTELRGRPGDPQERLEAVLGAYALITYQRGRHGTDELGALLHRGEHVARAEQQLVDLFTDLLSEVAAAGGLRDDVGVDELAGYCLHALAAARSLPSEAAVRRLVAVTATGLRSQS
jgi:AcrR family transcriptional regulator